MLLIPEKIIFIHIPKTGGTSVEDFIMDIYGYKRNECLLNKGFGIDLDLKEQNQVPYPIMHYRLKTILKIVELNNAVIDNSWNIFSIVRNPYHKFLSDLVFNNCTNFKYNYHMIPDYFKIKYLNSCIDEYFDHPVLYNHHSYHSLPQYKFFEDTDVNYKIFKFEEGLENIMKKLGYEIKTKFPHKFNIPMTLNIPKPDYSKMLTPYLVETINNKYEKDFEIFGYEMLNPNNIT